jgi:YidC/Oxa1 family membrane protein insertase
MDKKAIIGILLAVVGLVAWQIQSGKKMMQYRKDLQAWEEAEAARQAELAKSAPTPEVAADGKPGATAPLEKPTAPATPAVEAKTEVLNSGAVEYTFTNIGGGVARAKLRDHVIDKKSGRQVVLNEFGTIPIGAVTFAPGEKADEPYTIARDDAAHTVTFERTDEKQLVTTKRFTVPQLAGLKGADLLREEYLVRLDVTYANRGTQPVKLPEYWVHTGSAAPLHEYDAPLYIGLNYVRDTSNKFINLGWFAGGGMFFWKTPPRAVYPAAPETMTNVRWAAVANQYFTTLITPIVDPKAQIADQEKQRGVGVWARRFTIPAEQWTKAERQYNSGREIHGVDGALAMGGQEVPPGQSVSRSFHVLAGPSEYRRLKQFNDYETEILDFVMFGMISKGLLNALNSFKGWFGTYWAAIMVLTILIRSAMWPLQNRANQTAKKMAALSPKLKELQERYRDDPMRMQQETTKLWKHYGINPVGGCLPMLVQIPIFFGFYNMLNKAVELRNNGFLWVQDLSQPDTVARLTLPIFGQIPINPLPLVMAATMLTQMRLTPKAGDPMQQRMMMFMPLIFIALCYNYAAALALYWSVQNLFSIVQLLVTRNQQPVTLEPPPPSSPSKKNKR